MPGVYCLLRAGYTEANSVLFDRFIDTVSHIDWDEIHVGPSFKFNDKDYGDSPQSFEPLYYAINELDNVLTYLDFHDELSLLSFAAWIVPIIEKLKGASGPNT